MAHNPSLNCAVTSTHLECLESAKNLAAELHLPFIENPSDNIEWRLVVTPERLELHHQKNIFGGPIYVDFLSGALAYREKHGGGKLQLLAKAVGIKSHYKPTVLDGTAGLGRDAFVLASLGCKVHMLERSPIIAALLQDGLKRAKKNSNFNQKHQMSLIVADSLKYLQTICCKIALNKQTNTENELGVIPDVIYLDPMYPARTKSALVKKELRAIKTIVGDDVDAGELLALALKIGVKRVVVKRPKAAPHLNHLKPDIIYRGGATRFDVYTKMIQK